MTAQMSVRIILALTLFGFIKKSPSAGIGRQDKLKIY